MNAKEIKFLQLFETFSKKDYLHNFDALKSSMKAFMDLDFSYGLIIWEYIAVTYESFLGQSKEADMMISDAMFAFLSARAVTKVLKAMQESEILNKTAYQYSSHALTDVRFTHFSDLILSSKFSLADEIIRHLNKNEYISFGEFMKKSFDRIIVELLKKNPAKIEMNKKLKDYLWGAVRKVRTSEKAMLEQRLREIG